MYEKRIINGNVYIDFTWKKLHIYINNEKIALLDERLYPAKEEINAKGLKILPGLIDPHVHFALNLGHIVACDDFLNGSTQAAYGGVTTFIDFLEPVDTVEGLEKAFYARLEEAKDSKVDYAFHACIKNPICDLEAFILKMKSLGLTTLKLFTTYSDSNRRTYDEDIIKLLALSQKHNILILAHIENDDVIRLSDDFTHKDLPESRPSISETIEALKLAEYTKQTNGNLYMVHLSSGKTLEALKMAYPKLLNKHFYIESCPQYFTFTKEKLLGKEGELFTFAPPLRTQEEQDLLFKYKNLIYSIGTDHCAFMKKDKTRSKLKDIPLGIGGIEHSFHVMHHHLGDDCITKMSLNPSIVHHLKGKGEIALGKDADLFFYKPKIGKISEHHSTCDYSVYTGRAKEGQIVHTMVRGNFVLKNNEIQPHTGKFIKRSV
ncbi:MAG: dihydroorotase [Candidatus Izemoplasmataceae bacterium]